MKGRLALALAVVLLAGADEPKGKKKSDLDHLQGTWQVVGTESDGEKSPAEAIKEANLRLIIKGNKFTYLSGANKVNEGTLKVDAGKKTLDAEGTNPWGEKERTVGTYEIKGDTMRVVFVSAGQERPTRFETKKGSEATIFVYQRVKDEKKDKD